MQNIDIYKPKFIGKSMVGIVGQTKLKLKDKVPQMTEKLKYTNEERVDVWNDRFVSLGRVRHKQVWKGAAPKFNKSKTKAILFEGEIFDYEDEKRKLAGLGYQFSAEEDPAEFVLAAFEEYGIDGFKKLNGSYSGAIYSPRDKDVVLFCDRLGSRPLFYHLTKEGDLVFGTQVSSILQAEGLELSLNIEAVFDFFTFEKLVGTRTYYREIQALPPAGVLRYKNGNFSLQKFWEFTYNEIDGSEEDYSDKLANLIKQSIERRTRDGLRYGLLLSGGLDSRSILAASKKPMTCFTFADSYNNEVKIAKKIAKMCGAEHHFLKRELDHYANMIDAAVEIGDGRYCFYQAQGVGFFNEINKHCDAVFHGFLFDTMFKGCWDRPTEEGATRDYRSVILNDSFYSQNIKAIFSQKSQELFEKSIDKTISGVLSRADKNGAAKYDRVYNYHIFPSAYEELDYLHAMHANSYNVERSISFDNDLVDLSFNMPLKFRKGPELFKKTLYKINSGVAEVPNANYSVYSKIPFPIKKFVRKTQRVLRKIGPLSKLSATNPANTQISWSNFTQLIINNEKLRNRITETIDDPEAIYPELFDVVEIKRRLEAHLAEKEEHSRFLFQVLTFGVWCKKYGPKSRRKNL
jgi:asparagine synthase (glutamine-hydrolysing)